MQRALGVIGNEPTQRSSGRIDEILTSKAVKHLLLSSNEPSKFKPIQCFKGNKKISAYKAISLPELCELMLKVRDYAKENDIELGIRQKAVVIQSDFIIRSLAKVGIIALVDEVTGYEKFKEKDALQGLSEAYQFVRTKLPTLHNISFPNPQIENLQREIDGVFYLLQSQN